MEAKNFRIGNLVTDGVFTITITAIKERVIKGPMDDLKAEYSFNIENIEPIPLTEEWLLKCGFEKVGSNYQKGWLLLHGNIKTGTIDFLLNEPYSNKYNATVLSYLHQLQNLYYCLTAEELVVNI